MNYADLVSPGVLNNSFRLRMDCAKAISAVEIVSKTGVAGITTAEVLRDFFIACANKADIAAGNSGTAVTTLAPDQVVVTSGVLVTAPVTGTGTTGVTPTIEDGTITELALS